MNYDPGDNMENQSSILQTIYKLQTCEKWKESEKCTMIMQTSENNNTQHAQDLCVLYIHGDNDF